MADIRDVIRFAGASNPVLFGPAALAAEVGYNLYPGEKKKASSEKPIGAVVSYLNEKPYQIYAGEDYGPQSVASYLRLRQQDPNRFPRPMGLDAQKPQAKPPVLTPGATTPDWNAPAGATAGGSFAGATEGWGTAQDVGTEGFPTDVKTPGKEPGFEELIQLLKTQMSPEARRDVTNEAIRQYVATTAISQALGAEKSRERYKREVELERIKQWTDLAKTTMQTNMLSQALLGQALVASQQPSANVADILGKGTQAAQSVLGGFQLRS